MLLASSKRLAAKHPWVYILACKGNTIYVGFTRRLHARLQSHFAGEGAVFTKLHKPLRVLELIEVKSEADEYKIWCAHAHHLGTQRCGGYNMILAHKFGFDWEYPVRYTRRSYTLTKSICKEFSACLTFGGKKNVPAPTILSVQSVKVQPTVLKRLKLVLNL